MAADYFRDRHEGPIERTNESVTPALWRALVATVNRFLKKDYFAKYFPEHCDDGNGTCGTDAEMMSDIIKVVVHDLKYWPLLKDNQPSLMSIMSMIEYCHEKIAKPVNYSNNFHSYYSHYHFHEFDIEAGRSEFRQEVNELLMRSGLVYELQENGVVTRVIPPALQELLQASEFRTQDDELNAMLQTARKKIADKNPAQRSESLEKLWDALERVKSITIPGIDKKRQSVEALLKRVSPEEEFRKRLNNETLELSEIGNRFMIRHSETDRIPIKDSHHIDYLFHRCFSLISLFLTQIPVNQTPPPTSTAKTPPKEPPADDWPF